MTTATTTRTTGTTRAITTTVITPKVTSTTATIAKAATAITTYKSNIKIIQKNCSGRPFSANSEFHGIALFVNAIGALCGK